MSFRAKLLCIVFLSAFGMVAVTGAEQAIPLPNGSFEQDLEGWPVPAGEGMSSVSPEQAASGRYFLKIVDDHDTNGSSAMSVRVGINGAGAFELRGKVFPVSGSGLGIYPHV
ncbi:MAG: hypothetical protein COZ06_21665 [Armatimonadetes bacterium CG_4_10_14_3_um_filter_66_18]|nr:hypothetical protein [Armatimonadota bacterium]OIP00982.1 MAG: hypothetical protein AUJ96_18080 [Armatimonadetes bacterium CG2_30_66_41]PIU87908.1 MAG: hypothetical protein COS65_32275 [Armatimonadetes bacterium CG06_land_8_20_14_3_00_66_21]PIX39777.1 MAG: hypothetical protein COZ57_27565 [Armatimonadetes bacterium CG_4_8_14_3_um_filter_66_20]PIY43955.1 MAG: hypothetical protein COZ06_21665 [Armatimonadetes bacterium CG_4_10_14_3_um_filter_66_18]PIZ45589.1 MAG: hypothetical protein COY42_12